MTPIAFPKLGALPNLSQQIEQIDPPSMEQVGKAVGKSADRAIGRLLGRSRTPIWPWLVSGLGLVVVLGVVTAWLAFLRRPDWFGAAARPNGSITEDAMGVAENEGMTAGVALDTFQLETSHQLETSPDDDVLVAAGIIPPVELA